MEGFRMTRSSARAASALDSSASSSLRPDKPESVCLAFGVSWADKERLLSFAQMFPEKHIVASSDSTGVESSAQVFGEFRPSEFGSVEGFLGTLRPNTVFACIDWFWLENNYYFYRYKLNWIEKALKAFERYPAFEMLLLPRYGSDGSGSGVERTDPLFDAMIRDGVPLLQAAGLGVSSLTYTEAETVVPIVRSTKAWGDAVHAAAEDPLSPVHAEACRILRDPQRAPRTVRSNFLSQKSVAFVAIYRQTRLGGGSGGEHKKTQRTKRRSTSRSSQSTKSR